jgi:NADPH:quinone reductase-like Zn-dependent oxidoreductase
MAASVDPVDVLVLSGLGRNERAAAAGEAVVLGRDFSGVVVEVGFNVQDLKGSILQNSVSDENFSDKFSNSKF